MKETGFFLLEKLYSRIGLSGITMGIVRGVLSIDAPAIRLASINQRVDSTAPERRNRDAGPSLQTGISRISLSPPTQIPNHSDCNIR
jgi:hypothetical protein